MSRQPEGVIKDAARKVARSHGLLFRQMEGKGVNGLPDTLAGRYPKGTGILHIEWKTPTGVLSAQQVLRHAEIRDAGGIVAVCRSVEDYEIAVGLRADPDLQPVPGVYR